MRTPDSPPATRGARQTPVPEGGLDVACLVHALTPLLWLPQAACVAWAVAGLHAGAGLAGVVWPAAGIVLAGLLRAVLEAWSADRMFAQARQLLGRCRDRAVDAVAARSPLDRQRPHAGAVASALAEQAEAMLPWLTRYRSAAWRARLVPALILLPVAWHAWAAALVLVVAAPLIPLFMMIVGWRAKAASEAQWLQLGEMNAFLLDRLRGLPTLRALGAIETTAQRLRAGAEDLRRRTMHVLRIAFLSSAVLELFSALGVAMVAAYVGFHLLGHFDFGTWGRRLSLAEGLFVLMLAPAFFEPLRELAAVWHDRAAGQAASEALDRLAEPGLALPGGAAPPPPVQSRPRHATGRRPPPPGVRVRDLGFAFPGERPVFQGWSMDIRPGEHVALMGGSGAGKTVLLALLAGLLSPTAGRIEIGGHALTDASAAALRRRMAWMSQHPHVFAGSAQHNIALGREGIDDAEVRHAIRWAGLGEVAQARPGTSLGEGGTGLSRGEVARLALARLVTTPDADLLLADEPTAHLDADTAASVIEALVALAQGRTLIVATHDPLLAARMDRIIPLSAPSPAGAPVPGDCHGA